MDFKLNTNYTYNTNILKRNIIEYKPKILATMISFYYQYQYNTK